MKVLVDTSVWSLALRKKKLTADKKAVVAELEDLIKDLRVVMVGPVRQELLSGLADEEQYEILKAKLAVFNDLFISTEDYEKAACFYNICRKKGIQGSHVDYLLCSIAANHDLLIFTLDRDFEHYSRHLPVGLYKDYPQSRPGH